MNSEGVAGMSNREKGAWATLLTTVVIFGLYFGLVAVGSADQTVTGQMIGRLVGAIVLQVIALIVLHTVFAISSGAEEADERDAMIELRAERYGSVVLAVGVVTTMLALMFVEAFRDSGDPARWPDLNAFVTTHLLLGCLVASEIVKHGLQVFYYRRGS